MATAILELKNVLKHREQGGATFELSVQHLKLNKGQFIAVVGESGCGKSTLLDILALVSKPTSCEQFVYYDTEIIDIKKLWKKKQEKILAKLRRSHFGYVLQTGGLLPFLTVLQNLELASEINGFHNSEIEKLAKRLDINNILHKKPQYLSGGQRQRVAILRAIIHHPQIILADEPTAAVDETRALHIIEDFHAIAKENGTIIVMVTHNCNLIAPFADVIYGFDVSDESDTLTKSSLLKL
ncbi:MAG: ATP-binding cassette domain-containing protein [Candidatus Marithrix sp.]|nr:ATP-binding cassette domain-containing protein [Candidatus Marithrix sp.]